MKRVGIISGLLGPVFFAVMVTLLTIAEYDFLLGLGWHPLRAPTFDWPSGLALGCCGRLMTATFILSGAMMALFAVQLGANLTSDVDPAVQYPPRRGLPDQLTPARIGSALLVLAGLALMGLAFTTDPTIRSTPATWHGRLHDGSFVLLGLTLLPAMLCLAWAFQRDRRWSSLAGFTWLAAALAAPAFILKGIVFYPFLGAVLLWSESTAWRLYRLSAGPPRRPPPGPGGPGKFPSFIFL